MALYAIGDIQGCHGALTALLQRIDFDPDADRLWFTGDLVNRGPDSLATLRLVRSLGDRAVTVLGNHDLHLLAVATGQRSPGRADTLAEVLAAPDRDELLAWLRGRPLAVDDPEHGVFMVHAGLAPQWTLDVALKCAQELREILVHDHTARDYFRHMSGDTPTTWSAQLTGWPRLRVITNALTRLRYCDASGAMRLGEKGPPQRLGRGSVRPWFDWRDGYDDARTVVFGHWSSLGLLDTGRVVGLDSGCVWGGHLSAVRLYPGPRQYHQIRCRNGHDAQ